MIACSCPGRNEEYPNSFRASVTFLGMPIHNNMAVKIILYYANVSKNIPSGRPFLSLKTGSTERGTVGVMDERED